jgi:hypothetical protein
MVLLLGGLVIVFGIFRIWIGLKKPANDEGIPQKGLFAYPPRRQILFGAIYILLGVLLILPVFGVRIPMFGFLGQ